MEERMIHCIGEDKRSESSRRIGELRRQLPLDWDIYSLPRPQTTRTPPPRSAGGLSSSVKFAGLFGTLKTRLRFRAWGAGVTCSGGILLLSAWASYLGHDTGCISDTNSRVLDQPTPQLQGFFSTSGQLFIAGGFRLLDQPETELQAFFVFFRVANLADSCALSKSWRAGGVSPRRNALSPGANAPGRKN
jgi:hypothetical protein